MRATFRPLPAWPYPRQKRRPATYRVSYDRTLHDLEREVGYLKGKEIILGVVTDDSQIRIDGMLRADARVGHGGVEVSFEVPSGERLTFHTDTHSDWRDNLRAIVLGLEALRAVDRYGITSTAEQYAGFKQLPMGGPDPEVGRRLVERFGSIGEALRATHPDTREGAFTDSDFASVQSYRRLQAGQR
jgi:hypothetical protein